jgi:hypothetical protein
MSLDSALCAVLLFAAAVAGWMLAGRQRAASRLYLRFAAILLSGLAVCAAVPGHPDLGAAAALFILPLASAALAVAMLARFAWRFSAPVASLLLAAMLAMGLMAALTGWTMVSLVPVALFALLIAAVALGGGAGLAALSALALLASALVFLQQGARGGMLLFLAAAIVGLSRSTGAVDAAVAGVRKPAIGRLG